MLFLLILFFSSVGSVSSFSVDVKGPLDDEVIKAGSQVHFIVTVKNFTGEEGYEGKQDVVFIYEIKGPDGEIVYQKTDTKAVLVGINTSTPYKETFYLSDSVKSGFYMLDTSITSLDGVDSCESYVGFKVVRVEGFSSDLLIFLFAIGFVVAVAAFFYEHRKVSRMKVSGRDLERYIGKKNK